MAARAVPPQRSPEAPERERDLEHHLTNNESNDPPPVEAPGSDIRDLQLRVGYQLLRGMVRDRANGATAARPPAASTTTATTPSPAERRQ